MHANDLTGIGPEGPARRDVGPFTDATQATNQFTAQMHGMPTAVAYGPGPMMVVSEACLMAGLELTDYEQHELRGLSCQSAVIVAGLILRAHLATTTAGEPA